MTTTDLPSVLAISLPGSPRRSALRENLERTGLSWRIMDGLRRAEEGQVPYRAEVARKTWGQELLPAEIGCAASHLEAARQIAAGPADAWTIVMEDDVLLDPGFPFGETVRMCVTLDLPYLRLYSRMMPGHRMIGWAKRRGLLRFQKGPTGTQAYMMSGRSARQFFDSVPFIARAIDFEIDRFWNNGLHNYALYPYPVLEMEFTSTIARPREIAGARGFGERMARHWAVIGDRCRRLRKNLELAARDRSLRRAWVANEFQL